jgi:hypothetical protein
MVESQGDTVGTSGCYPVPLERDASSQPKADAPLAQSLPLRKKKIKYIPQ